MSEDASRGYQFGTLKGVFTPSILTILGVVMYLRFGWAIGNVGPLQTIIIITMASMITFFTGLSLASLASNMKVEGGGSYFIISRSLGIEAGAAVGIPLFFGQALGISFYFVGFAEAFTSELPQVVPAMVSYLPLSPEISQWCLLHPVKVIGVVSLIILTAVAYKSADLALRGQLVIMVVVFFSLISFFMGGAPSGDLVVPEAAVLTRKSFWPVFAVLFPAVTGIESGIAMSGDLKNPARSLPLGTISAIMTGYILYLCVVIFMWVSVGNKDALLYYPMMMSNVARWGKPVLLGIWAASLSSALGVLLGAPRTLQALARDRVIPKIFGKGFGKGNDPRIATGTAFLVGLIGILVGDLNVIAPVLSMFFLTTYGLMNTSAGLEELTGPPSWRPKFSIPWYMSLFGAFICFAAMFMINAGATFSAAFIAFTVFFLMERRSLKARWGDMRRAVLMLIAKRSIQALARRNPDERTWQPNILVLSGAPTARWHLVQLASSIARDRGFLAVGAILPADTPADRIESISVTIAEYLERKNVSALVKVHTAETPLKGAMTLSKTYGYGPITPNTILLGVTERPEHYSDFADLISMINSARKNLVVVREQADSEDERDGGDRIDIWWYGTQHNLGFMLALAYLLKRGPGWRKANLVLKTIVSKPEERHEQICQLESFINKVRLDASAEVLVKEEGSIFENIRRHSEGADLLFLGMRPPAEDEKPAIYRKYYQDLLSETKDLPPTAFVLAAEDMDFYAIFHES